MLAPLRSRSALNGDRPSPASPLLVKHGPAGRGYREAAAQAHRRDADHAYSVSRMLVGHACRLWAARSRPGCFRRSRAGQLCRRDAAGSARGGQLSDEQLPAECAGAAAHSEAWPRRSGLALRIAVAAATWLAGEVTADSVAAARSDTQHAIVAAVGRTQIADYWAGCLDGEPRVARAAPAVETIRAGLSSKVVLSALALLDSKDATTAAEAAELGVLLALVRPDLATQAGLAGRLVRALDSSLLAVSNGPGAGDHDELERCQRLAGCVAAIVRRRVAPRSALAPVHCSRYPSVLVWVCAVSELFVSATAGVEARRRWQARAGRLR